jgi:hypothetical protein
MEEEEVRAFVLVWRRRRCVLRRRRRRCVLSSLSLYRALSRTAVRSRCCCDNMCPFVLVKQVK